MIEALLLLSLLAARPQMPTTGVGPSPAAAGGGGNVPAFVQGNSADNVASVSFSSNVTAGNAIYIVGFDGSGSGHTLTFSDTQGNTFTTNKQVNLATDGDTVGAACAIAGSSGADTLSMKVNGSAHNGAFVIYEISGATCTVDQAGSNNSTGITSCDSGSITTAFSNDFLLGACGLSHNTQTFHLGAGWSNLFSSGTEAGGNNPVAAEVIAGTNTAGASYDAQMSLTSGTYSSWERGSLVLAYKHS